MNDTDNQPEAGSEAVIAQRIFEKSAAHATNDTVDEGDPNEDNAEIEDQSDEGEEGDTEVKSNEGDDDGDTDSEDTDEEPKLYTVKINGKDEQVTESELVSGYMKDADYRQKTAEIARQREELEVQSREISDLTQQKKNLVAELGVLSGLINQMPYSEEQLAQLRQNNPTQYLLAKEANERRQQQINALKGRTEQIAAELTEDEIKADNAVRQNMLTKLYEVMPSMNNKEAQGRFYEYASGLGFSEQDIATVRDHRVIVAFEKARLFDEMQAKANQKPKHGVPKVVKGGATRKTSTEVRQSKVQEAAKRAKSTGSVDDVAALLMAKRQRN